MSTLRHFRLAVLILVISLATVGNVAAQGGQPPSPPDGQGPPGQGPQGGQGPGQGGPLADGNQLSTHRIHLATSSDGLHWIYDDTIIREATSVPTIVYWQNGLWIFAVNGEASDDFERLISLKLLPNGTWQENFINVEFEGRLVDPDAVVLPDGRLRLYLFDFSVLSTSLSLNELEATEGSHYSIVTEDGINFEVEDGVRLTTMPPTTDPSVIQQASGDWWMFVSHTATSPALMTIAHSTDGLDFEEVGTSQNGGIAGTALLDDGAAMRQYVCGPTGMRVQDSEDGLNWTLIEDVELPPGCDPSVTRFLDGTWVMVYKTIEGLGGQQGPGQPPQGGTGQVPQGPGGQSQPPNTASSN